MKHRVRFGDAQFGAGTPQRTKRFLKSEPPAVISPHVGYLHGYTTDATSTEDYQRNTKLDLLSQNLSAQDVGKILFNLTFEANVAEDYEALKNYEVNLEGDEFFTSSQLHYSRSLNPPPLSDAEKEFLLEGEKFFDQSDEFVKDATSFFDEAEYETDYPPSKLPLKRVLSDGTRNRVEKRVVRKKKRT